MHIEYIALIRNSRENGVKEIGVPGLKDSITNHFIEPTLGAVR